MLVLVVLGAALLGGRTSGLIAAASSAICFDFFFTKPYYSLSIANRDDVETTIVLLIVGLAVGELVVRSRRYAAQAELHERAVEYLRASAALAAGGAPEGLPHPGGAAQSSWRCWAPSRRRSNGHR